MVGTSNESLPKMAIDTMTFWVINLQPLLLNSLDQDPWSSHGTHREMNSSTGWWYTNQKKSMALPNKHRFNNQRVLG